MKGRFFALAILLLIWTTTANSQAPAPLLDKIVTPVNATSNVAVNVSLDPGFVLSGTILGDPAYVPNSIVAVSSTGSFTASINQTTHTYRIALPAGTYNLNVSFSTSNAAVTTFTYGDSTPVTVTADTTRNITLPTVSTSSITGNISNLNVLFPVRNVTFDSTTVPGFSDVTASSALDPSGNYSVQLPNGTFPVTLSQISRSLTTFSSSTLTTSPLGSAVVSGPANINFAAPTVPTATLSGTISITGSSSIPANTALLGADVSGFPLPITISSGSELLPSMGAYSFLFATGRSYGISPSIQVQLLAPPAPMGIFSPPDPGLPQPPLTANTIRNITYPALPGPAAPVTISGHVTVTGSTKPVPKVSVTATSSALSVGPDTFFEQHATTNANGDYSLVVPAGTYTLIFHAELAASGDFDGDGQADIGVFRPSNGTWYIIPSGSPTSFIVYQWGTTGDLVVPGDYDGDGEMDTAVFRPSNGTWYIVPSSKPGTFIVQQWGTSGDIPVPGDYDGDGKTDIAVFRPSSGTWFIIPSSNPSAPIITQWGTQGDIPVPGDYDGDNRTDVAVFRPSSGTWFILPSSNPGSPILKQWGTSGDIPVPGDYDGDGRTDFAVWRPSNGTWYIIPSGNPGVPIVQQWGTTGDIPAPADYDGDQIADIAVWRPSNGTWYIIPSSTPTNFTVTQWGTNGDVPVQKPIQKPIVEPDQNCSGCWDY